MPTVFENTIRNATGSPTAVSRFAGPGGLYNSELDKGVLVVLPTPAPPPTKKSDPPEAAGPGRILRFQYNPETITRTRAGVWDYRKVKKGQKETPVASETEQVLQKSYRGGGLFVKSETIVIKLIFDATEAILAGFDPTGEVGVLPELAVLEQISFGADARQEQESEEAKKAREKAKLSPIYPSECLLVLGSRRFPVVVTALTITEKRFSSRLIPIRAEVDVTMRILESGEIQTNSPSLDAFKQILEKRQADATIAGGNNTVEQILKDLMPASAGKS